MAFAHRGARLEEPENTLPAFARALAQGAPGLESDAWLSRDGEVVLVHDAVVSRGLRRRRVESSTADELAAFGVPRLADLYAELGTGFELSIDVKVNEAAQPLLDAAGAVDALDRLWVCSPDADLLAGLRPRTVAHLVHSPPRKRMVKVPLERHAADLAQAGIEAVNLHESDWTAGLVSLFQRFDLLAFAWDAQEVRHLRALLQMGIDGVYCDRPDRMVAAVGEWSTGGGRSDEGLG